MEVKLDYIAIPTANLEKLKDFYVQYFGAAAETNGVSCLLSFKGGFKIKLIWEEQAEQHVVPSPAARSPYTVRLTFRAGGRRRVNEITCRLVLDGHEVISEPGTSGMSHYSSSVYDPDGNLIELVA